MVDDSDRATAARIREGEVFGIPLDEILVAGRRRCAEALVYLLGCVVRREKLRNALRFSADSLTLQTRGEDVAEL